MFRQSSAEFYQVAAALEYVSVVRSSRGKSDYLVAVYAAAHQIRGPESVIAD